MSHQSEKVAFQKGYRVSACGEVVTSQRGTRRVLATNSKGYRTFSVSIAGSSYPVGVHRLQAYQKFGEAVFSFDCVRHLDSNPTNNSVGNIAVGTNSQNMMDQPHGLRLRKSLAATDAVRKHDHGAVLDFYLSCRSYGKTMKAFGITSKGTISFIVQNSMAGKRHAHIVEEAQ